MSEATYVLSGRVVTVEIPDNHGELIAKKEELKRERSAFAKRINGGVSTTQRINIDIELSRIKSELSIVNRRLLHFQQQKKKNKFKERWKKRHDSLIRRGITPFPYDEGWQEKYKWCFSLLEMAIALNHGRNESDLSNEDLLKLMDECFAGALDYERSIEFEKTLAESMLNR